MPDETRQALDRYAAQIYRLREKGELTPEETALLTEGDGILAEMAVDLLAVPSSGGPGASPKQIEMQAAFLAGNHRVYAAAGGNQSGKTEAIGAMCFCKHLRDRAKPDEIYWVIAKTAETQRDIPHRTLWKYLPRRMFPDGVEYQPKLGFGLIPTLKLRLIGGSTCEVWFKSEEQDLSSFESSRLNGAWWTECEREGIFDAIFPRLAAKRGWLLMDYVPRMAWHKFRLRIPAETSNIDIKHIRFCMADNAHNLPPGEINFQRRHMTTDEASIRIDGKEGASFGTVFKEFDPERHVCKPFVLPKDWPRWRTMDYGYRNPTALLWASLAPVGFDAPWGKLTEETLIVYRELYERERTVKQNTTDILLLSGAEEYRGNVRIDPSAYNITQANGLSIAREYENEGLPCQPAVRTSVVGEHALIAKVRKWFEADKIRFFNTCPNAIREHQSWRYKEGRDGVVPSAEPFEDKNNHTIDALKGIIAEEPTFSYADPYYDPPDIDRE